MTSDAHQLLVRSERDVEITIYDAIGRKELVGIEQVEATVLRGLYRIHLERCGFVSEHLIRHDCSSQRTFDGPLVESATPLDIARASSSDPALMQALDRSDTETVPPIGRGPHTAWLRVFIRRLSDEVYAKGRAVREPISLHDVAGRELAVLAAGQRDAPCDMLACRIAAGTYRLRVGHARRDLAITIAADRAAHVFLADSGTISLRHARVYLPRVDDTFDPRGDIARAMESVLWALRTPNGELPPVARRLLPAIDRDLSFGMACAHLARRRDQTAFVEIMRSLVDHGSGLPDVALLERISESQATTAPSLASFATPPLFQSTLVLALEHQLQIALRSALVQAAKAGYDDSVWCTWSPRWWDERWIDPTVERVRSLHGTSSVTIEDLARSTRLPANVVELALTRLDATRPRGAGVPLPPERLLVPGYTLRDVVGRGDHSTVFRALSHDSGRDVALKIVPISSPEARRQIMHQLERAQRLGHKQLLRVDRSGVLPDGSALWLEMELCRESLFGHLATLEGPLDPDHASQLMLQALDALDYLHGQDIVHGKVHPGNLLIRNDGSVVLGAPALVDLQGEVERAVAADGDMVRFLAPEVLDRAELATAASDVWSIAATLCFLVTLETPRERYSDQSELEAAKESELTRDPGHPRAPPMLASCIARALAAQPSSRFRDGGDFHAELSSVIRRSRAARRAAELHDELVRTEAACAATIRNLFVRMSATSDGEIARRRVRRAELTFRDPAENQRVEIVLQRFHDAQLITFGIERTTSGAAHAFIEPADDDLVSSWGSVRAWLDELDAVPGSRGLLVELEVAARSWGADGRARSLWGDPRAEVADRIRRDGRFAYNALEDEFVRRSARRRQSRRLGMPAVVAAFAMVSGCLYWQAGNAIESASHAASARDDAQQNLSGSLQETARQFVQDGRMSQAIPYLVAARESGPAGPALRALFHAASRGLSIITTLRHRESVANAAFSPDGSRVVTASADWTARLWNAATGAEIATLEHKGAVVSAAFSRDGKRIVTASEDRTAQIWDAETGRALTGPLKHQHFVRSAMFSPDDKHVVTASLDHTARIWSTKTGALEHELKHGEAVWSAVFSPDGTRVVTASRDRTARIWSVATGDAIGAPLEHRDIVWSAMFNADGARIVTASQDRTARVWDAITGNAIGRPLEHGDGVTAAAFDRGGTRVVTASYDNTARVWDATTGTAITPWLEHEGNVTSVAFSPDGARVLTAGADGAARIWDAGTGRRLGPLFEHAGAVTSAAFNAEGTRVVTASSDKTARVWDVSGDAPAVALELPMGARGSTFSSDARWIMAVSGDDAVALWDTATGKRSDKLFVHSALAQTATFSPDDQLILATNDRTVRIWSRTTGDVVGQPIENPGRVISAAFSPDGSRIVIVSGNRATPKTDTLQIWSIATGAPIPVVMEGPGQLLNASWSPDATRLVTLNRDRRVRLWNTMTGERIIGASAMPLLEYAGGVIDVSFSPDGTWLVTGADDGTARVWNARTGALAAPPVIHSGRVLQASFSPDGGRIVTVCEDRTARVWDARTGKPLTQPMAHDEPIVRAAFSADGARLVTTDSHTVRTWDVALDQGTLQDWATLATKSPYVLEDGVLVQRSLSVGANSTRRTHPKLPSS